MIRRTAMKLSEILKENCYTSEMSKELHSKDTCPRCKSNTALTSCDREIDREALAKVMYEVSVNYDGFKPVLFVLEDLVPWEEQLTSIKESYLLKADLTISTMPTWLKRSEKK